MGATIPLAVLAFSVGIAVAPLGRPAAPKAPEPDPVTWARPQRADTLARGGSLSHVLGSRGFDSGQIREITQHVRAYRDPRTLRPGAALRFALAPDGLPDRIRLALNPDSVLHLVRSDSVWTTRVEMVPFVMDTVRISALVESSLWSARLAGDLDRFGKAEFEELVYDLADVFAWKVDFARDLRRGDALRVALERKVRPDGSIRSRHFLVIELVNRGRVFRAIPKELPGERYAYYDEEGRSLRGAFLRYPVPYRITSRYTKRRFHPVLKRYRAHQGIDYGAPRGAPVEATASGVVTRAGFAGGYGRLVELSHPRGIRTRYAHLSSIAADVRPGARVEQGQIIGRVGSSGLATGPHLHYEFIQNGRQRNPFTVELPGGASIGALELAEFRRTRDQALALLEGVTLLDETRLASWDGPDRKVVRSR
ncbi:MAG TPA: M23 family metallopeptidase [Candidatus Eisenbacteria bacterium]|nr:M23 family metallopeptidase [Candidatus Eisenbacteria bacterium]